MLQKTGGGGSQCKWMNVKWTSGDRGPYCLLGWLGSRGEARVGRGREVREGWEKLEPTCGEEKDHGEKSGWVCRKGGGAGEEHIDPREMSLGNSI